MNLPLIVTCPSCGERTKVRRNWHAMVTADTAIEPEAGPYPLENEDTEVDESEFDQYCPFYCAECGEDIAKTEEELMDMIKEQKDV